MVKFLKIATKNNRNENNFIKNRSNKLFYFVKIKKKKIHHFIIFKKNKKLFSFLLQYHIIPFLTFAFILNHYHIQNTLISKHFLSIKPILIYFVLSTLSYSYSYCSLHLCIQHSNLF